MAKYKAGDYCIVIVPGSRYGRRVKVETSFIATTGAIVYVMEGDDPGSFYTDFRFYAEEIVHEEVFNSPLYKALSEDEDV